ncbi:MAG: LAGLIDADG family homing endonuclease [Candidatus Omnitrophota bacterium]
MDHTSLKNLLSLTKIPMPESIEILEDYWSAKKYSRIGALKRFQMHGALGTPEGRRKGGLATQRLIRTDPVWALQSGIVVRKKIYDPGYSLELAEFIGIMLGDGGLTNYQLNITLNSQTDREYLLYVKNLLEKLFHIQPSVMLRKKENAARIVASGRNLVELLKRYGLKVGNKVRQSVDIPAWVLRKNEFAIACLRGLMDTDGCCYAYAHNVNKKRYYNFGLCFTNASLPLLKSVYTILEKNGYHPCVASRRVYVHRKNEIAKYFQKVGTHNNKHLHKYQEFFDCGV